MDANAKTLLKGSNLDGYIDKWTSEAQQADQLLAAWVILTDVGKADKGRSLLDKITDKTPGYTLPVACQLQEAVKKSPELSKKFMELGQKTFKFADTFHQSV
jgi:hypothetical protein